MNVNDYSYSLNMATSFSHDPCDFASQLQSSSIMLPSFFGSPNVVSETQLYPIEGFAKSQPDGQIYSKQPTSRKEKSLHILCQLFMHDYPDYPSTGQEILINLEEKSKQLKVERRRVYDIINVLESLEIVTRKQKNEYVWKGRVSLVQTLAKFKTLADMHGVSEQLERVRLLEQARESGFINSMEPIEDSASKAAESLGVHEKKDKSLGVMAKKFVMLFLSAKNQVVTMDAAAKILAEEDPVKLAVSRKIRGYDLTCKSLKSFLEKGYCEPKHFPKIRRLYDIANVLKSLQLIKKEKLIDSGVRKAAFRWISYKPANLPQFYPGLSVVPSRPKSNNPQGSPPNKKPREFLMAEVASAVNMLTKKEKICAGIASSAVSTVQETMKEIYPIEKKLQPLLRTPGKKPENSHCKQTHFIQSVPLHNSSLWLLPKTELDSNSTCLPNNFALNTSNVYDAFVNSSAPQTLNEDHGRQFLRYSSNLSDTFSNFSRCHDLSFCQNRKQESRSLDSPSAVKERCFSSSKYESPRNPLLCQMEATEDENEAISDTVVNPSHFVNTESMKTVNVKFPSILPAAGRAVVEEIHESVNVFHNEEETIEEETLSVSKNGNEAPEFSEGERDKAILSFVYNLAPSTSQYGEVNEYMLSLNNTAGPVNPIKSFSLSIPETATSLERPIGITCAPLNALFPIEYPTTWNYFSGYEQNFPIPNFACSAPNGSASFPWCNPAITSLDYVGVSPFGGENPNPNHVLLDSEVPNNICDLNHDRVELLTSSGISDLSTGHRPETENNITGATESGIYLGLGMNSFCDNPTSTSAPHTPGSVLTHDFMPLYAQTSQSGTNGTPINLSCSATSPSFNPNVLFGNHEIYKNFMESSSAGPIFTNDSNLPINVNRAHLPPAPSLYDSVKYTSIVYPYDRVPPSFESANRSSVVDIPDHSDLSNFATQNNLSSLAQPSNFGLQFANDVAYNLSAACDLSLNSNEGMLANNFVTSSATNDTESLEYSRLMSPANIECDTTLISCCDVEQRV